MSVETIGFPDSMNILQQGMMNSRNYLQEIRSTIQSASRFLKKFPVKNLF